MNLLSALRRLLEARLQDKAKKARRAKQEARKTEDRSQRDVKAAASSQTRQQEKESGKSKWPVHRAARTPPPSTDEYIASLRAACDIEGRDRVLRTSEIVKESHEYLRSLGIDPKTEMSLTDLLSAKTDILASRMATAIDRLGLAVQRMPRIVLLPTEDFNAWAMSAPNGDPLCVLDPGLSATLLQFSWSLAEATIDSPESAVERDYVKCCFGAIAACEEFVYGGHEPARQYLRSVNFRTNEARFMFGVFLSRAIESFILSHEFAHHVLGHVTTLRKDVLQRSRRRQPPIGVYNRSQIQEFEADCLGAKIFLKTASELYSPHFLCAPLVLFDYLSFAETYVMRNPASSTHPPAKERKVRLESHIWKELPSEAKDYYTVTPPFWSLVEKVKRISTT